MARKPARNTGGWRKTPVWIACFLFLSSFGVYTLTLNPSLFRNDSPETITACVTLGISHPPGYPLHTLLGRVFYGLSLGGPAMTLNFFSAFLGALGVALLGMNAWILIKRFEVDKKRDSSRFVLIICCFIGALSFAFSKSYWSASLAAKGGIYTLQVVLELLFLLAVQIKWDEIKNLETQKNLPSFYFLLFLFSLGLANHWPTQVLLTAALGFSIIVRADFKKKQWVKRLRLKNVWAGLTITAVVASLYLYLPLRSNLNPRLNFWTPSNASRFFSFIFRMKYIQIETMASYIPSVLSTLYRKSIYISGHFLNDFGALYILLTAAGVFGLWRSGRKPLLFFLVSLLGITLFANLFYLQAAPIEYWHMDDHLLTLNWVLAILGTAGAFVSIKRFGQWVAIPLLLLIILTFQMNIKVNDQKSEFLYRGYGMEILKSMNENPIYFAETDYDYFSLLYLTEVEQKRKDLSLFNTPFLSKTDWEKLSLNRFPHKSSKPLHLYCCFPNGPFFARYLEHSKQGYFKPTGLVLQINSPRETFQSSLRLKPLEDFWAKYLSSAKRSTNPIDGLLLEICAHPYLNTANYLKLKKDLSHWDAFYLDALSLIQEPAWQAETWAQMAKGDLVLWKKGVAVGDLFQASQKYFVAGQLDQARASLQMALMLDPSNMELKRALANLQRP